MEQTPDLNLDDMRAAVHEALAAWDQLSPEGEGLLGDLLLVQEQRAALGDRHNPLVLRRATNNVLEAAIAELSREDATGAAILRARFVEGQITRQVAAKLYASPDQVNRWQRAALENLARIVASREQAQREARLEQFESALPSPSYTRLFGLRDTRKEIVRLLLSEGEPYIVAIAGIGGIGKTSLADAVTREVMQNLAFDQVVWLRATTKTLDGLPLFAADSSEQVLGDLVAALGLLPALGESRDARINRLRPVLNAKPHLVIVDNVETEAQTVNLLEQMRALSQPTKFVLTTRARPTVAPAAYFASVDELSLADAEALIRDHAQNIGVAGLANASPADVRAIYRLTGGNPLALKLVTGLAAVLSLDQILQSLAANRAGAIEGLYRHIYREAWRALTPNARCVLETMPLVSSTGALPEQMQAMCRLDDADFWPAVTELYSRSLIEVRGTLHQRRYSIHHLTETFLRTEIIKWDDYEG